MPSSDYRDAVGLRERRHGVARSWGSILTTMRLRLIALAGAAALMASAVPAHAGAPLPRLLTKDFATTFAVKPPHVFVSGDGSAILAGTAAWIGRNPNPKDVAGEFGTIAWETWTATSATGLGFYWLDNCKPNCATGTYYPHPVAIVASHARKAVFTRLAITGGALAPIGRGKTITFTLQHLSNGYVWNT
jgi:hypothetical protein